MLSTRRQEDWTYPVPRLDLSVRDVEGFAAELRQVHDRFDDCFFRSETRENTALYLSGLFSSLERKSVEPIALGVHGVPVRTLQHTMSGAKWDEERFALRLREFVAEDIGHPEGALVFDETAFVKKGDKSVGVARQYCGTIGKVENGQVGVFAAYVSPSGYALLDKYLYMPDKWFDDDHAERRKACSVPEDLTFQTKPQLAAAMLRGLRSEGTLSFRWVLADSVYGENEAFLQAADECVGGSWFVSVARTTLCWKDGEPRRDKPRPVEALAESIPTTLWYRRTVSEGTKGPIRYEFARLRVVLSRGGEAIRTVWLLVKRTLDRSRTWYYLSNAPQSTRLGVFVWLSGLRWAIEQCFEEAKTELGMDHYELRGWAGWNRHMLLCMVAHAFLRHLKIRLGEKNASGYNLADPEGAAPRPSATTPDLA